MCRPVKVDRRRVVDAIFYVVATGCRWRPFPIAIRTRTRAPLPLGLVQRRHLGTHRRASRRGGAPKRGTPGRTVGRLVDARSVRAAATVSKETKGFDAGKKINGRKTFGIVDTLGLLIAVVVVAASTSDNVGGIKVANRPANAPPASPSSGATLVQAPFIEHRRTIMSASKSSTASTPVALRCSRNA